jgi:hypothetical protein
MIIDSKVFHALLTAAKEALSELTPTGGDSPGYYADSRQVKRLADAIKEAETELNKKCDCHYCQGGMVQ